MLQVLQITSFISLLLSIKRNVRLVIACCLLFCSVAVSAAQEPRAEPSVEVHRATLQRVAEEIFDANEETLLRLREEVRSIRLAADTEVVPLRARIVEVQADIQRIGPEITEGITEPPSIANLRQSLRAELEALDAIVRQADLNIIEANRLLNDISNRRRDAFYSRVLERDKPPFTFSAFATVTEAIKNDLGTFGSRYLAWKASFERPGQFRTVWLSLILSVIAAFSLLFPVPRWLDRSLLAKYKTVEPTPARRGTLAALRVVTRAIPALMGATIIYQVSVANGIVTDDTSKLVGSILLALGTIFVVDDVATAIFAPKEPKWRIICIPSRRATLVRALLVLIVVVFSANAVLNRLSEWLGSQRELVTSLSAYIVVIGAILLFILARPQLWKPSDQRPMDMSPEAKSFWRWTRILAALVAILSIFAVLVGHVALGRFVLTRIYYLSFLAMGIWFVRALLEELAGRVGEQVTKALSTAENTQSTERKEDSRLLVFWLSLLIDIALFAISVPLTLLILGVNWTDMRNWVTDIIVGVEVGGVNISLARIFSAFFVAFVIFAATRFIQRTVDKRIFVPARMEGGLRNTLRTLLGYTGLIFGAIVGIGMLGFPLANLALVAGALSLGIGFGLQSIVNNFVSGLILLFERPIKVGDWIVTSAGEGIVKRISVRSTEIETFDWSSVIIPNAELVTAPVTNWTHKNRYTRLIVPVGVSYNSDPEAVSAILMKEAKSNRRTLSYPAPVIYFAGFGDSSLDFQVRIFINNVDDRIPVQNELRFAIFRAFKEAGIEIPFPQRDLHVRHLVPGTVMAGEPHDEDAESDIAPDRAEGEDPD